MFLYILTIIMTLAFVISFVYDKRKLSNAFLFLASLGLIFLSCAWFAYDQQLEILHSLLMLFLYASVLIGLLLFSVGMIINGFVILKKERVSLANGLSTLFGVVILLYASAAILFIRYTVDLRQYNYVLGRVVHYGFVVVSFFFVVLMFVFFAFLAYSILYIALPKKKDYDYIIIHGSGLVDGTVVPPLLAARIDRAIEAYRVATKKDVKIIASGGKGSDEKISEARAIADRLLAKGVKESDILLEDRSTTTYENLKFSQKIATRQKEDPKYLFVSNNYHVFRVTLYAKRLHMRGDGLGARTARYYIPSAFLREYVAILHKIKWVLVGIATLFLLLVYLAQ